MSIKIDYEQARKNHFKTDAEKALQTFISGEAGTSFILFPQALNPFLRALESLGTMKQVMVLPIVFEDGKSKPAYVIVKLPAKSCVTSIETEEVE